MPKRKGFTKAQQKKGLESMLKSLKSGKNKEGQRLTARAKKLMAGRLLKADLISLETARKYGLKVAGKSAKKPAKKGAKKGAKRGAKKGAKRGARRSSSAFTPKRRAKRAASRKAQKGFIKKVMGDVSKGPMPRMIKVEEIYGAAPRTVRRTTRRTGRKGR